MFLGKIAKRKFGFLKMKSLTKKWKKWKKMENFTILWKKGEKMKRFFWGRGCKIRYV